MQASKLVHCGFNLLSGVRVDRLPEAPLLFLSSEKWVRHQTGTAQSSQGWDEGSIGRKVRAGTGAVGTHRREAGCTSLLGKEEEGQFGQRDSVC